MELSPGADRRPCPGPQGVWIPRSGRLGKPHISSEIIVPILPLDLSVALGSPPVIISLMDGAAEAVASLIKAYSGYLSDRLGRRKPLMALGYGLSNLVKPLIGVAGSWGPILALRVADRFGKGLLSVKRLTRPVTQMLRPSLVDLCSAVLAILHLFRACVCAEPFQSRNPCCISLHCHRPSQVDFHRFRSHPSSYIERPPG